MADSLDVIVSRDCPAKSRALNIFGKRCAYIGSRCLVPDAYAIKDCRVYAQHNKSSTILHSTSSSDKDVHETNMGIGACDEYGARQYNGR